MSYASAEIIAGQYPQYAAQIAVAAKESFLQGSDYAYIVGIIAVLLGAVLIFFKYPRKEDERELEAGYHAKDMAALQEVFARQKAAPAAAQAPTSDH